MLNPDQEIYSRKQESRLTALEELLRTFERTIVEQSERLERVRSAESNLAAIVESSEDAIVSLSLDLTIQTWNRGAEKLFGFTAAEAIGQLTTLYIPPDLRDRGLALLKALLTNLDRPQSFEVPCLRKDGTCVDVWTVCFGIRDANGKLVGMSAIHRDLTEHKQAEREQGLLAALVKSSDDGIVTVGLDGQITTWNAAAEKLCGFTAEEAVGHDLVDLLVPPDLRERAKAGVLRRFADAAAGHPLAVRHPEVPALRKDGSTIDVSVSVSGIYDSAGRLLGASSIIHDVGERKRALREQALLAALVATSDDAIISLSTDFRITSWNLGAQRLLGYTQEEVLGQRPLDLYVPPGDRAMALAMMTGDLATVTDNPQAVHPFEVPLHRKDGSLIEVAMVACGIRDAAGKVIGLSTIMRDVTERKRAERETARLAAIVETSDDAIMSVSPDGRISYWNHAAERMFGFTAAEAIGQPLTLHIPPERHAHAQQVTDQLMAHPDQVIRFEGPNRRKDGTIIEVSTLLFAIRDRDGNVAAISAIQRDVTETKRADREAALLAAIVNASHDAIMSVSPEAKIVTWNPAAAKAYGYTAEEAIGKGVDLFVPPEELQQTMATTRSVVETGQPASWEQHARRRDGARFVSSVNIFPIRDAVGNITGVAGIGRDITRLKDVEKDLREARDYTRGLIESSIDAMVIVDRELRISDGNEQLAKLTEVPKKVLIGSRFDSYFTEPANAAAAIEKALADGWIANYDLVLRAASGKEILVSFNASVFSRAGVVSGIFGVARDVTEQRAIQNRLAEEQQYSSSLVESSPDALLVADSELTITDLNGQMACLTSYSRQDLVGVKLASIFTEPDKMTGVVRRALEEGIVHEAELGLLTRTAEEIPVSLNASAFKTSDGSTRGVIIGVRDISERQRAEKERSLLASIVDASGDAIYSESADLTITSWNDAAERLFGYAAAEIIGRHVAVLVPLAERAKMIEHLSAISGTGKAERFETVRQRKDGASVEVLLTRSPILDAAHKLAGFSIIAHDISDRKRAEAELTAARDAALEAARAKSEFLANMSHEIRTPLNSVIGMTGLLLDTQLTPEQRDFAHDVRESGEALLTLINEILDFSKLAAGKVVLEEIDFELTALVESAVELVGEQARRKVLELTVSIDSEAPQRLCGDPGRLRQVLLNLIGNAIKFTPSGEVAVQVGKLSENSREVMLRFEVRDTGIGIPQDKVHLLFQPFSQVDASTTRHFGGTGLGLSIARQLVERMGGTIAVASTPGSGSTFWFTAKFARPLGAAKPASERFASFANVKVLVVDDNANSLQILGSQLSAWKMEVERANSADSALGLMRAAAPDHPFQVVLADMQMPEVDGLELARRIKSEPAFAATAVIIVSSVGSANDFRSRLQGLEIGGWLTKPVPQSSLYNALVKVLMRGDEIERDAPALRTQTASVEPAREASLQSFAQRKLRVLLAEDNPINQKLAKFQLKKLGADVDCVGNGREAVEAVMRLPYDVVLMDCQMPEMDGFEATKEIRRLQGAHRHTPIVALTAHALVGDRETCLAAGMDAYISKPVKPELLESILAQVTAADRELAATAHTATPDSPAAIDATSGATTSASQPAQADEAAQPAHALNGHAPT